jgi:hypothetical protein
MVLVYPLRCYHNTNEKGDIILLDVVLHQKLHGLYALYSEFQLCYRFLFGLLL